MNDLVVRFQQRIPINAPDFDAFGRLQWMHLIESHQLASTYRRSKDVGICAIVI
jgi:hypothetical protein